MHSMLYVTAGSEEETAKLARHLLERRLIACANIFRARSLFRWKGKVSDEAEFVMIMKTRTERVSEAIAEAARVHSYEVPCIVSYRMGEAFPAFLKWIDSETSEQDRGIKRGPRNSRSRRLPSSASRRPSSRT